ncbi:MAG: mini-circle protein, partial [Candidatus Dormibacteraeota bacterium]|nr:mini-circle protein [Candidatus Dormibacteraeota bacterium]
MREAAPDPPKGLDEKATLSAFLDWYRDVVVRK